MQCYNSLYSIILNSANTKHKYRTAKLLGMKAHKLCTGPWCCSRWRSSRRSCCRSWHWCCCCCCRRRRQRFVNYCWCWRTRIKL